MNCFCLLFKEIDNRCIQCYICARLWNSLSSINLYNKNVKIVERDFTKKPNFVVLLINFLHKKNCERFWILLINKLYNTKSVAKLLIVTSCVCASYYSWRVVFTSVHLQQSSVPFLCIVYSWVSLVIQLVNGFINRDLTSFKTSCYGMSTPHARSSSHLM